MKERPTHRVKRDSRDEISAIALLSRDIHKGAKQLFLFLFIYFFVAKICRIATFPREKKQVLKLSRFVEDLGRFPNLDIDLTIK